MFFKLILFKNISKYIFVYLLKIIFNINTSKQFKNKKIIILNKKN